MIDAKEAYFCIAEAAIHARRVLSDEKIAVGDADSSLQKSILTHVTFPIYNDSVMTALFNCAA